MTETTLKPSLASVGVVNVALGDLLGRRDVPAEAVVELASKEDLEDDDGDGGRCAMRSRRSAIEIIERRAWLPTARWRRTNLFEVRSRRPSRRAS